MGRSKALEQLNTEFQKFIDTQDAKRQIDANITKYYSHGKWDDQKPLISGIYTHSANLKKGSVFQGFTSEWSLEHLIKMSDKIKSAIFGGPIPTGSTATPQDGNLADAIAKITPMDLLITSAAFNTIEGILVDFALNMKTVYLPLSKDTEIQKDYVTKELAPGLTIFLCIIDIELMITDAFGSQVCQTGYLYDIRFSIKQAGNLANFNELNSLKSEQYAAETLASKCDTALRNLHEKSEHYVALFNKYTIIKHSCNNRIAALKVKTDALKGK